MPTLPTNIQPPPLTTPFFSSQGRLSEEWQRFHLRVQQAVQALLDFTHHLGSNPGILPFEDVDAGEPLLAFGIPSVPTPPSAPSLPAVMPWMDTEEADINAIQIGATPATPGGSNTQVQFNDNGVFNGDPLLTWTKGTGPLTEGGGLNIQQTPTDGLLLENTTPATAGVTIQRAPRLHFLGHAWDTGALADKNIDMTMELRPTSGNPTNSFTFWSQRVGASGFSDQVKFGSGLLGCSNVFVVSEISVYASDPVAGNNPGYGNGGGVIAVPSSGGVFYFQNQVQLRSPANGQMEWDNGNRTTGVGVDIATDAVLKLRNRSLTAGTGSLDVGATINAYNNVSTAGWGVPAIYAAGRSTAQTAAVASVAAYTVGAADGTFEVSANVLVTTATTHNFTVTCAYTDESNTARTLTMAFTLVAGTLTTAIVNGNGAVPYMGLPAHIRCKASTSITIASSGTFTTVTYNIEGIIKQMA